MTLIKEINDLHIALKAMVLSMITIMPFWFISIYLFHKGFYHLNPVYVTIIFTFCFSIVSYFVCHLTINKIIDINEGYKYVRDANYQFRLSWTFLMSTLAHVVWSSALICFNLYLKHDFYRFLAYFYIPIILIFLLISQAKPKKT